MIKNITALSIFLFISNHAFALGALANDQVINHYGASWNANSKKKAEKYALLECSKRGNTQCQIIGYFSNSCIAVARDSREEGRMISGYALGKKNLWDAKKIAMKNCESAGGSDCLITISACDGDNNNTGEPYLTSFKSSPKAIQKKMSVENGLN